MNTSIYELLDSDGAELLRSYQELEEMRCRREAIPKLNAFVEYVNALPDEQQTLISRYLYESDRDECCEIKIRHPLFKGVILPILLNDYRMKRIGSARALLHFRPLLYGGNLCHDFIHEDELNHVVLYEEAIRQEPENRELRLLRLEDEAYYFNYSVHEVPYGVLYGNDGASVENCKEFISDLDEFEKLVKVEGVESQYAEMIKECRSHYTWYIDYLLNYDNYDSYECYLKRNGYL